MARPSEPVTAQFVIWNAGQSAILLTALFKWDVSSLIR